MPGTMLQTPGSARPSGGTGVPAPPSPPAFPQTAGLPALREQLGQLQIELAGLKAEWNGLNTQLDRMRLDNPARPPVQGKAADVGVQIAQVQGQIATVQSQLAIIERGAFPGERGPVFPPRNRQPSMDPDAVTAIFIIFMLAVLMPLSIGLARRLWRRGSASEARVADPMVAPRLERLEQAVDAIAIEIERVSEGQRFITKILAERPAASSPMGAATGRDAGTSPSDPPIRALGAGPIETIRVAERQSVRPSITPH
jgi:hypothetical protein